MTLCQPLQNDVAANQMLLERHLQQTNDRLCCIQKQLQSPSTFHTAAEELLEWCSDIRAFQPHYEDGLIKCLLVSIQEENKTDFCPGSLCVGLVV